MRPDVRPDVRPEVRLHQWMEEVECRAAKSTLQALVRRLVGSGEASEERKKSDAEQLANRLASFPEYNPNPVVETDLDGNVVYVNPAAQEVNGEEIVEGQLHPLARDLRSILGRLMHQGEGFLSREVEVQGAVFDQKIIYVPDALVIRIYSHDITRLKASKEAIRSASEEMQMLAQGERTPG